ncbi:MAG: DUF1232 domain-containing protein [Chloroflexi bacterium]|nr:DUF1232 domain-containing protein [Chloroflexota bacterium]
MSTFRDIAHTLSRELGIYRRALAHPRTGWAPRLLLTAALAYFVLPIDILPDFIPVIGQLDDLLIVPGLIWLALRLIPGDVMAECRQPLPTATTMQDEATG